MVQGWLILAPDLSIAYINARAERGCTFANLLVRGMPMDQALSIPQLEEAFVSTRYQQRPQRSEWEHLGTFWKPPSLARWVAGADPEPSAAGAQQQQGTLAARSTTKTPPRPGCWPRPAEMAVEGSDTVLVQRLQRERAAAVDGGGPAGVVAPRKQLPQESSSYTAITLEDLVDSAWTSIRPLAEEREVTMDLDRPKQGQ